MSAKSMVVTDLDGTLFQSGQRISPRNYRTLEDLGKRDVVRVVATGRNLFSARKVLPVDFPIDFLVFSSGAGIMDWPAQKLLFRSTMGEGDIARACDALWKRALDFMVHRPIPDNHHFLFFASGLQNPDFEARCRLYREFAQPGGEGETPPTEACQLVAIEAHSRPVSHYAEIRRELADLYVVRTTSPLDGRSRWIEIFSMDVSKALSSARIRDLLGIPQQAVMAIGNDYNDLDLLDWAPQSFVVRRSPRELLDRFEAVDSADEADFSEAVSRWQQQLL